MPDTIDIIFRTLAVAGSVLLAVLLLVTHRRKQTTLTGALLCLSIAAFFVTSAPGSSHATGIWYYPLTALCVTKAAWFWLFARALFNENASLGGPQLAIVGAVACAGTWQQTDFLPLFREGSASTWESVAGIGFESGLLLLVLLGLYEAGRDIAIDLVERRRRLRFGFIVATGVYLVMTLAVQTYNLVLNVSTPLAAARINMVAATIVCFAAAWFLVRPREESWLDPASAAKVVALNPVESALLADLKLALQTDRIFLQEGLTIGALAEHLGTREHVLRQVINRGMGYRNFNDFLHAQRIQKACVELVKPEQARMPVLSIAMDVGYGSIGAFNRAFKARIGMTPTDYRRSESNSVSRSR